MSQPVKFVYVSLDRHLEFQKKREENRNIVPCSLYIDNEDHTVYFVEEPIGPVYDFTLDISDKVLGL